MRMNLCALVCLIGLFGCSSKSTNNTSGNNTNQRADMANTTGEDMAADMSGADMPADMAVDMAPPPTEGSFALLTYNVAGLPEGASSSKPSEYHPQISPKLNAFDVVLVQEDFYYHKKLVTDITHPHVSETYAEMKGYNYPKVLDLGDGLNRFSRFPIGEVTRTQWPGCNGDATSCASDCLASKGFSFSTMTLPGDRVVHVYNLHKEAGGCPEDETLRAQGVELLIQTIKDQSEGVAVIVAGDFNLHVDRAEDPDRGVFERLLEGASLRDVCWTLDCGDEHIDRILTRSGGGVELTPTRWWVAPEFVTAAGEDLSDHKPIAAQLTWKATIE